jgi:hypothetical protein
MNAYAVFFGLPRRFCGADTSSALILDAGALVAGTLTTVGAACSRRLELLRRVRAGTASVLAVPAVVVVELCFLRVVTWLLGVAAGSAVALGAGVLGTGALASDVLDAALVT